MFCQANLPGKLWQFFWGQWTSTKFSGYFPLHVSALCAKSQAGEMCEFFISEFYKLPRLSQVASHNYWQLVTSFVAKQQKWWNQGAIASSAVCKAMHVVGQRFLVSACEFMFVVSLCAMGGKWCSGVASHDSPYRASSVSWLEVTKHLELTTNFHLDFSVLAGSAGLPLVNSDYTVPEEECRWVNILVMCYVCRISHENFL